MITVAFDTFKGCVSGIEASEYVAARLRRSGFEANALALADGGEGTGRALALLYGGSELDIDTVDAFGAPVCARAYMLPTGVVAVDMASCIGLGDREGTERARVMEASSYGLGLLLRRLTERFAPASILLGAGGSASCDGGLGMLAALGVNIRYRKKGESDTSLLHTCESDTSLLQDTSLLSLLSLLPTGECLQYVESIDMSRIVALPPITLLCDVRAPLLGPEGAAMRYSPQKGATPAQALLLDAALKHWCRIVAQNLGADAETLAYTPGMGVAGGITLGARLMGWTEVDGADYIAGLLIDRMQVTDLIITGEGRTDRSTLQGKAPYALMLRAKAADIPTALLSGHITLSRRLLLSAGFACAEAVTPQQFTAADITRQDTLERLADAAEDIVAQMYG